MPTKYGVYYNLNESEFEVLSGGLLFVFSSKPHLEKFRRDLFKKQEWLNDSLSRRFGVPIHVSNLAAVQLYQQIEKRGFLIKNVRGDVFTSPHQMQFIVKLVNENGDYIG